MQSVGCCHPIILGFASLAISKHKLTLVDYSRPALKQNGQVLLCTWLSICFFFWCFQVYISNMATYRDPDWICNVYSVNFGNSMPIRKGSKGSTGSCETPFEVKLISQPLDVKKIFRKSLFVHFRAQNYSRILSCLLAARMNIKKEGFSSVARGENAKCHYGRKSVKTKKIQVACP